MPTHTVTRSSQKQLLLLFHIWRNLSIMFEYCLNSTAVLCEYLLTLRKTGLFYLQLLHPVTIHSIPAWNLVPLEDHEKQLNTTEIFYSQIMVPPCDHSPRSWLLREHVERMYSWCSNHPEIRRARFRCRPTSRTDNCVWQDLFPESKVRKVRDWQ